MSKRQKRFAFQDEEIYLASAGELVCELKMDIKNHAYKLVDEFISTSKHLLKNHKTCCFHVPEEYLEICRELLDRLEYHYVTTSDGFEVSIAQETFDKYEQ